MSVQTNAPLDQATLQRRAGGNGFGPLLHKELQTWWGGRRWLYQGVLWLVIINGLLLMMLFVIPAASPEDAAALGDDPVVSGLQGFFSLGSLALAIGIILLSGDALTTEITSGTAEWLMTKPISRESFVLSKLAAHSIGMLAVLIALPGLVAYILLTMVGPVSPFFFAGGMAVITLHTFFYLTLTLMLGALTTNRSVVMGAALGTLLGGQILLNMLIMMPIAPLAFLMPWMLPQVAEMAAVPPGLPAGLWAPIIATVFWSGLFIAIAVRRFRNMEL